MLRRQPGTTLIVALAAIATSIGKPCSVIATKAFVFCRLSSAVRWANFASDCRWWRMWKTPMEDPNGSCISAPRPQIHITSIESCPSLLSAQLILACHRSRYRPSICHQLGYVIQLLRAFYGNRTTRLTKLLNCCAPSMRLVKHAFYVISSGMLFNLSVPSLLSSQVTIVYP